MDHNGSLLRLFSTAAKQCGVIRHSQAAKELHPMEIYRLAAAQRWKRLLPGVYADPTQGGLEQDLFAAWLWAGKNAVVSHRSAAKLLGLDGVEPKRAELTVPPHLHPTSSSVIVHRTVLPAEDRCLWRGLPITRAARTLVDLAGVVSIENLAMAVDCAWRRRLAPLEWIERRIRELGAQGRRGMDALAQVLRDCRSRGKPLDSALEVKLWWQWSSSGLPRPVPSLEYQDEFGQPGRIDFAFPRENRFRGKLLVLAHPLLPHLGERLLAAEDQIDVGLAEFLPLLGQLLHRLLATFRLLRRALELTSRIRRKLLHQGRLGSLLVQHPLPQSALADDGVDHLLQSEHVLNR